MRAKLDSIVSQQVAKNTLYLTIASIGQKVIAFVYFLFLARIMMPENTGAYFLALSITTIFSVITDFGVTPVVIREIAKYPENTLSLIRRALGVKIPFIGLGIIGAIIAGTLLSYSIEVQQLIWLACIVMGVDAISLLYYGALRGHHILKFEALGMFLGQSCTALAGGLVLSLHPSLPLLIFALILGSSFNAIFSALMVARRYTTRCLIPSWDTKQMKQLLKIALPFALAAIFVKIYSYVDTVFISKFIGNVAVGIYSVAYKFTYAFQFLPLAFVAALYPGLSSLVGKDEKALARMFDKGMWYMLILAMPITFGIWAIASDVVLLAGEEYMAAGPVLGLLVFVLIPIFLDFPIGSLLNAANRQATKTAIMGVTMVINILLNVILIPTIGVIGAAIAALVSFTFMFVVGLYFVPKIIPQYRFRRLAGIAAPIVISGLVMAFAAFSLNQIMDYYFVIPIGGAVYFIMLFLTKSVPKQHIQSAIALCKGVLKPYAKDASLND